MEMQLAATSHQTMKVRYTKHKPGVTNLSENASYFLCTD